MQAANKHLPNRNKLSAFPWPRVASFRCVWLDVYCLTHIYESFTGRGYSPSPLFRIVTALDRRLLFVRTESVRSQALVITTLHIRAIFVYSLSVVCTLLLSEVMGSATLYHRCTNGHLGVILRDTSRHFLDFVSRRAPSCKAWHSLGYGLSASPSAQTWGELELAASTPYRRIITDVCCKCRQMRRPEAPRTM
ncbi:hypothetical protein CC79DRAFT_9251 [Sarocladium strictum]